MKNNTQIERPRHSWLSLNRTLVIDLVAEGEKVVRNALEQPEGAATADVLNQMQACILELESKLYEPVAFNDPDFDFNGFSIQDFVDQLPQQNYEISLFASSRYVMVKATRLSLKFDELSVVELIEKVLDEEPKFVGPSKGEVDWSNFSPENSDEHLLWDWKWALVKGLIVSEGEDESQLTHDELINRINNDPVALAFYSDDPDYSKLTHHQLAQVLELETSLENILNLDGKDQAEETDDEGHPEQSLAELLQSVWKLTTLAS